MVRVNVKELYEVLYKKIIKSLRSFKNDNRSIRNFLGKLATQLSKKTQTRARTHAQGFVGNMAGM